MANENRPIQQPQTREDPYQKSGEVVVEIGGTNNPNVKFKPTDSDLRGRWERSNLIGKDVGDLIKMPEIPGMQIVIDPRRRTACFRDPLNRSDNSELLRRVSGIHKEIFHTDCRVEKDKEFKDMTDEKLKTWLRELRILVDEGLAFLISGDLPSMEAIMRLPGKCRIEYYNKHPKADRYLEDTQLYKDKVAAGLV